MKKRGFTLAEVLVALSIIAIAAALMVPAYTRFKPDRYKFRVLNAYKFILETNHALLNNENIYYRRDTGDGGFDENSMMNAAGTIILPSNQYGCIGLFCTGMPTADTGFNDNKYTGVCKYPNLMKEMLNLNPATVCSNNGATHTASGTAPDTSLWTITNVLNDSSGGDIAYRISVDLDPKNTAAQSCSYSSSCTRPDIFTFYVDRNGDIDLNRPENQNGMDALTKTYIRNMENIYKEDDFTQASQGG